jgi:hypothetical protein
MRQHAFRGNANANEDCRKASTCKDSSSDFVRGVACGEDITRGLLSDDQCTTITDVDNIRAVYTVLWATFIF